jgi:hypothetical protein
VKSQKKDFNDALAIAEAVAMPTIRLVPDLAPLQALGKAMTTKKQQAATLLEYPMVVRQIAMQGEIPSTSAAEVVHQVNVMAVVCCSAG